MSSWGDVSDNELPGMWSAADFTGGAPDEVRGSGKPGDMPSAGPYDVRGKLDGQVDALSVALGKWRNRDDTRPQPEVRQAANTAMDIIDAMLADLHRFRARLVGEIRDSDDANAARVDAMLRDVKKPS